ncbi:esterase/lipase family protein [Lysobacter koreensis]|uniref:Esterase/lipase family protein n=1 Tax=Lysobacter koreensis TaxID=266122 RepID=A0ABW2YLL3_9GAMM
MTTRIVLLHGIWMPGAAMGWLAARLAEAGFAPETFGYHGVVGGPDAALPRLVATLARGDAHVLAHSLGGLIALQTLQQHPQLPVQRVVCLGSPLCGSAAAHGLRQRRWTAATLGRSAGLLENGCAAWSGRAQVGAIAGRVPHGLGRLFGHFEGDNDGSVAVAETRLAGLADHVVIAASHSGFLFSAEAVRQAVAFFRDGRFRH